MDKVATNVSLVQTYIYTIILAIPIAQVVYIVFPQLGLVKLAVQLEPFRWMVNRDVIIHVLVVLINTVINAIRVNNNLLIVI